MNQNQTVITNEAKYKEIFNRKKAHPGTPLVKLCDEAGTSYQSYNNWLKKQQRTQEGPRHSLRVTVQLSINDIVKLIVNNVKEVPVSVQALVRGLPPEERKLLAEALGAYTLDGIKGSTPTDA